MRPVVNDKLAQFFSYNFAARPQRQTGGSGVADTQAKSLRQALDNAELTLLVKAIATQHDDAALSQLYDQTVGQVYRLAHAMTGNADDAEEIVCDVYLQVWQRASQYDEKRGPVIAWLMVNCRSLALDLLRRRRSHQTVLRKLEEQGEDDVEDTNIVDLLALVQEGTAVHRALGELSEIQRRLIALAYFNDLSHSEIAALAQLPLGTVKSHIQRGLRKLRTLLDL